MSRDLIATLNKSAKRMAVILPICLGSAISHAGDFTAGVVATKMGEADRYPFVAGIVEGLAYARYKKDGDKTDGMKCIYTWFYDTKGRTQEILDTFKKFPDYTAGAVLAAMVGKECGT